MQSEANFLVSQLHTILHRLENISNDNLEIIEEKEILPDVDLSEQLQQDDPELYTILNEVSDECPAPANQEMLDYIMPRSDLEDHNYCQDENDDVPLSYMLTFDKALEWWDYICEHSDKSYEAKVGEFSLKNDMTVKQLKNIISPATEQQNSNEQQTLSKKRKSNDIDVEVSERTFTNLKRKC